MYDSPPLSDQELPEDAPADEKSDSDKPGLLKRLTQVFVGALSLFLCLYTFLYFSVPPAELTQTQKQGLKTAAMVTYASEATHGFPKQGPDQCGAFSLSLGVMICSQDLIPGAQIASQITIESPSKTLSGTLPWRVVSFAKQQKLATSAYSARSVPLNERLDLLKFHLTENRPVIVLIESTRGIQHYIVVLGYHDGKIDLYDPNLQASAKKSGKTEDQNGAAAGNVSYSESQFLEHWQRGGVIGLYKWWYLPLNRIQ